MSTHRSSHVDSPEALGRRLQEARERAGFSQRQLSFEGCSAAYISRIEAGARTPSLGLLRELARRLGVSEEHLAYGREAEASVSLGVSDLEMAVRLGDDEAQQLIDDALDRTGNDVERAEALSWRGQLALRRDDPETARRLLEEALALGDDGYGTAGLRDSLGRSYISLGEDELALDLFERSLRHAEERDDLAEFVRFSILLANTLIDTGNLDRAEQLIGATLAKTEGWSDAIVRARLYWSQSRLHAGRREADTAARYARKAIGLIELTEDQSYAAGAHQLLAHIELDRGRAAEALVELERGLELLAGTATPLVWAKFRLEEARAYVQLGRSEEAAEIGMEAAGVMATTNPVDAGRGYQLIAESFEEQGDMERARELYELAVELLEKRPNRYLVSAYAHLGDLLERTGDEKAALQLFKKAVQIQASAGILS